MARICLTGNQKLRAASDDVLKRVNAIMALNHITQTQLAEYVNLSQPSVNAQLKGRATLSLDIVIAIYQMTGADVLRMKGEYI